MHPQALPKLHNPPAASIGLPRCEDGRRLTDIVVSGVLLVLLAPMLAAITLATFLQLGSPVIYRQSRLGHGMHAFTLLKFRTLRDRSVDGRELSERERCTRLGQFLRHTRLDELPQLWNVLIGEMTLIGPRPLITDEIMQAGELACERFQVRPGMTGWAQVHGGRRLNSNEKIALDIWYIKHRTTCRDLEVMLKTLRMVILGEVVNHRALALAGLARKLG